MIRAIFYSKFDTQEGPKVIHQVPEGAVVPSTTAQPGQPQLISFSDIQLFVIPRQELCGNFIHVCSNGYRVLGCPICLTSPRYDRNQFIFDICIVLSEDEEFTSYKSVVLKLADLMCSLEEQSGFLSRDFAKSGTGKIHGLCETLMEDLNNYAECMIPIDELNTLNIKLFPLYPPPAPVKAWQVPLFIVRYEAFVDESWDLTMQRIVPFINGVNSTRMISVLADVDFSLTCRAIRHLVYYGCVFLLDIFSFNAIYAPTAQFNHTIAIDEEMQRECAAYVNTRFAPKKAAAAASAAARSGQSVAAESATPTPTPGTATGTGTGIAAADLLTPDSLLSVDLPGRPRARLAGAGSGIDKTEDVHEAIWPEIDGQYTTTTATTAASAGVTAKPPAAAASASATGPGPVPASAALTRTKRVVDGVGLVELYADLRQGKTVRQWYQQHIRELANIDVRRFITYGIIKGFLYRVRKYAVATDEPSPYHELFAYSHAHSHSMMHHQYQSTATAATAAATTAALNLDSCGSAAQVPNRASMGLRDAVATAAALTGAPGAGVPICLAPEGVVDRLDALNTRFQTLPDHKREFMIKTAAELGKYLDGQHHFDEICTDLELTEPELMDLLQVHPYQVHIIHR